MIVGIDEVGRGSWAGPLVVGAVMLGGAKISGLTDSKKISAKKRFEIATIIKKEAVAIGLGWVSAQNIDKLGLSKSLTLATQLALNDIAVDYDQIIIDGTVKFVDDPRVSTMKQADLLVPSVSAASIIAKVARDYYMTTTCHNELPQYGFDKHVGYGTALHQQALREHGVSSLHRQTFLPIKKLLGKQLVTEKTHFTQTAGAQAEEIATRFLVKHSFEIVTRNWRTRWCEIDIIARKNDVIYFIEVKHRAKHDSGDGLEAITKKKLNQMRFAAELWRKANNSDSDARLSVIACSGSPPNVTRWLPSVRE